MHSTASSEIQGPNWVEPGLDLRGGRYPLGVEAPVLGMVATLVPGVSTLSRIARYYSLYWALADSAGRGQLDADACLTVLRRAEVGLALASREAGDELPAHGVDQVTTLAGKTNAAMLAEVGRQSYSPRTWGFWSQYGGPSQTLGIVGVDAYALRPSRHECPAAVRAMFEPLLSRAAHRPVEWDEAGDFADLAIDMTGTPDIGPLRALFTATRRGTHAPADWVGNDHTRRATLRILARSVQLQPLAASSAAALRSAVAYGSHVDSDLVLSAERDRALAWRGVLLRHHSVGAWRRLWARVVGHVVDGDGSLTREDLHDWISGEMDGVTLRGFQAQLPAVCDEGGNPAPAEDTVRAVDRSASSDLAILLLGAARAGQLQGRAAQAFLGRAGGRGQFLDPSWVAHQAREHRDHQLAEFARAIVDDMLAQSRRVALRKLQVGKNGRMTLFTKLQERNGRYFATQREGDGNVGLRIVQLTAIAEQLDLFSHDGVTTVAQELLELPA
jgi:hypothetical protein